MTMFKENVCDGCRLRKDLCASTLSSFPDLNRPNHSPIFPLRNQPPSITIIITYKRTLLGAAMMNHVYMPLRVDL